MMTDSALMKLGFGSTLRLELRVLLQKLFLLDSLPTFDYQWHLTVDSIQPTL